MSRLRWQCVALLSLCACLDSRPQVHMADAQHGDPPDAGERRTGVPSDASVLADVGTTAPASDGCPCEQRCDCGEQCSALLWPSPAPQDVETSTCPLSLDPSCGRAVLGVLSFVAVGADDRQVQSLSELAECGDGHGWHTDGDSSQLCPETCALLKRVPGSLRLRLPCPTILCE